ncbi:7082_t:CDS:2 [Diversispora eburnea]|uniref:7082_t:CDS:1 n=1 Tax=Diversispora eburnea TaxID=1213867 RepID=A0A9N8UZR1_9GLOM|nr:7082_t:CDS:2 [Diversispora eburnea]
MFLLSVSYFGEGITHEIRPMKNNQPIPSLESVAFRVLSQLKVVPYTAETRVICPPVMVIVGIEPTEQNEVQTIITVFGDQKL